jgi:hypothetical protein
MAIKRKTAPNVDWIDGLKEDRHQEILIQWANLNQKLFPELKWLYASNQGVAYGGTQLENAKRGAKMKRQGLKKGVADLCLPVKRGAFSGLYIELKRQGGRPSIEQLEFGEFVTHQGFLFVVCMGWDSARETIENYLRAEC